MNSGVIVSFLKILGANDQEIALGCIVWLEQHGYVVSIVGRWERGNGLCKRLQISTSKFRRRLKRWQALGRKAELQRGLRGWLVLIRSNPELDAFLSASPSKPRPIAIAGSQVWDMTRVAKSAKIDSITEIPVPTVPTAKRGGKTA